jgi:hypothetical protein
MLDAGYWMPGLASSIQHPASFIADIADSTFNEIGRIQHNTP